MKTMPATMAITGTLRQLDKSRVAAGEDVLPMLFQPRFQLGGNLIERTQVAAFQRANVSNNSPAVLNRNLRTVGHHRGFSVGDSIEDLTVGLNHDEFVVQALHDGVAVFLHDAVAVALRAVTRKAVDF